MVCCIPWDPKILVPLAYAVVCWILYLIEDIIPASKRPSLYGIKPRTGKGLIGIFFAPLIHTSILNVLASSLGIIVIGYLLIRRSWIEFVLVTCFVVPVAGFMYWVVGTATVEGAEGVVLGWFGYLITSPIFERPVQGKSLLIAIVTAIIYIIILIFVPADRKVIIWVYNICGLISGVLIAVLNHKLCAKLFNGATLRHSDTKELMEVNNEQAYPENTATKDSAILTTKRTSTNPFEEL